MLGLFPKAYPDELVYSVMARYYVRSGYNKYIFVAEDLFQNKNVRPSFDYFPPLKDEVIKYLTKDESFKEVIRHNTMFPYHCRFLPLDHKQEALQALIEMKSNYFNLIPYPKRKIIPTMWYCPMCAADDRTTKGETYWHRIHQIIELPICPIHHCKIISTSFELSGRVSPDFVPAEIVIPYNCLVENYLDEKLCAIADYVNSVFDLPIKMENNIDIARVIKSKTENTKYRSPRGEICRITTLYNDFADRFKDIIEDLPMQWQIHKVITGQRFDFWEVTLLGFFLGIAPTTLQDGTTVEKPQNELFDDQIIELRKEGLSYPKIAEIMGQSVDAIKNAAYIKAKKTKPRKRRGGKPGRRPMDWQAMDKEILPKVKEVIEKLKISEKPQRITLGGVARIVGLRPKQIYKLSLCKAEIERNYQTQEQHWARKVLWAWGVLQKKGKVITIKQIRLQTNMNAEQIKRALPNLLSINRDVYDGLIKMM